MVKQDAMPEPTDIDDSRCPILALDAADANAEGMIPFRSATLLSLQIFTNPYPSYEVSWSLSCEMIFYAAWPALLLMSRLEVRRSFQFGMFCSLLTLALILVVWSQFHKLEDRAFVDGIWTLCALFPLWLCGAWLAEDWDALSAKISRRHWISGLLTFVAAMAFLFTLRYMQYPPWSVHMASWLALPGVFIGVAGARHLRMDTLSEKSQNLCRWLGLLSYPCYVLHLQLLHLADHYLSPLLPESWARQPLVLVGLYLVAALPPIAWAGPQIERAIMAWRGRMIKTARKPALPVAA